MGVRISEVVVQCRDAGRLSTFWCDVLGFEVLDTEPDGSIEIGPAAGFGGLQPTIILSPAAEPPPWSGRLHLDVNPVGSTRGDEVRRILALGGRHADVGQTGQEPWTVLQDPEGNVFCVLDTPLQP
jgi:catechol 2,3-dioxygenase-like lactoylglutathione lyase family enzyme